MVVILKAQEEEPFHFPFAQTSRGIVAQPTDGNGGEIHKIFCAGAAAVRAPRGLFANEKPYYYSMAHFKERAGFTRTNLLEKFCPQEVNAEKAAPCHRLRAAA